MLFRSEAGRDEREQRRVLQEHDAVEVRLGVHAEDGGLDRVERLVVRDGIGGPGEQHDTELHS